MLLARLKIFLPILVAVVSCYSVGLMAKKTTTVQFMDFFNVNQTRIKSRHNLNREKRRENGLGYRFHANCQTQKEKVLSIFENYLKLNRRSNLKTKLIREFLSLKYFQYYDLINSIMSSASKQELYDLKGNC